MSDIKFTKNILDFFKRLEQNNDRDWFNENKPEFKENERIAKQAYQQIFTNLNKHDNVDSFKVFRIYRDVRFSKNKLPYKIHFGGSFHRKKPELRGGYYVHIQPNNESFIATGVGIAILVDIARIPVYLTGAGLQELSGSSSLILTAVIAAFVGALFGKMILQKITMKSIRFIVGSLLLILGLLTAIGIL